MSDLNNLEDAKQTLRQLTLLSLDANRALYDGLQHPNSEPSSESRAMLNRTLENLRPMREGFMLALRVPDMTVTSELRAIINYLVDWSWLNEIGLRWNTDAPLEKLGGQVVLYQHAVIALGVLPRLPSNVVTFPGGKYADIPVPGTPGETLNRLEELENTIWAAATEPIGALSRGAVRRTYGFFEATTWLIATYLGKVVGW